MTIRARSVVLVITFLVLMAEAVLAGGPIIVGGPAVGTRPAFGHDGKPFVWNPAAMPIQYRVDPGPMASTAGGTIVISNGAGLQRLQSMFGVWQGVSTAKVSFSNAGTIQQTGSFTGGDVKTVAQFNAIGGSCDSGAQSPVIFDADGSLLSDLGLPTEVIGFTSPCALDTTNGYIKTAMILMNGQMQDGVDTGPNYELTVNQFDEAMTHEIGHLLGLDHSQINLDLLTSYSYPCDLDSLAGLPLMFPIEMCQARKNAGLPPLSPDDRAWLSALYPSSSFNSSYAMISGRIYFSDGVSQVQGANVIARLIDDPGTSEDETRRVAVSAISGYLFTGNIGQSVTAVLPEPTEDNTNGDPNGSRDPQLIGYYQIYVPPGTYTVEVESLYQSFNSDSGIGPLNPPIALPGAAEFWNQDESAFDFPGQRDTITVHAGEKVTDIDIILNQTEPTFDQFEDTGTLIDLPIVPQLGSEEGQCA